MGKKALLARWRGAQSSHCYTDFDAATVIVYTVIVYTVIVYTVIVVTATALTTPYKANETCTCVLVVATAGGAASAVLDTGSKIVPEGTLTSSALLSLSCSGQVQLMIHVQLTTELSDPGRHSYAATRITLHNHHCFLGGQSGSASHCWGCVYGCPGLRPFLQKPNVFSASAVTILFIASGVENKACVGAAEEVSGFQQHTKPYKPFPLTNLKT